MKIPPETPPLYLAEQLARPAADPQRTGPLEETAHLRKSPAEAPHQPAREKPNTPANATDSRNNRRPAEPENTAYTGEERRRYDRRRISEPTLLDTRLSRGRRKTDRTQTFPAIDLKA
ncbi:hypothetical protein [Propionivibrio limicola]|uniref:hypothetical protein n=1 Tax=Propionivibrio limicola TaxID=167645 RepID=UPI001291C90E|nr:hypothetical protein [Propionivibrio limicola]